MTFAETSRNSAETTHRRSRTRTYLMCRPEHFTVAYAINAWMDIHTQVNPTKAISQWETLRDTYVSLGHSVQTLDAIPGLPDMVFCANGAFSVDGVVYGARYKYTERSGEAPAHRSWYLAHGWPSVVEGSYVNEGEGDFTYVSGRGLILGGYGFRTELAAHAEAQELLRHPVVSLSLVDPHFYHLDVALFVLDDKNICYFPGAFSRESQSVLCQLFPSAVVASEQDALVFGLNAVSDGYNVVLPVEASGLTDQLAEHGYNPIPVDLSEFLKGGGSVKCCTAELRGDERSSNRIKTE